MKKAISNSRQLSTVNRQFPDNALVHLVAINVILFAVLKFLFLVYKVTDLNEDDYNRTVFSWFTLPADLSTLALRPWTVFTYMFTHEGVLHLLANMLWLWFFGFILQDITGNRRLVPLYIYGGIAGALFYLLFYQLSTVNHQLTFRGANTSVIAIAAAATILTPNYRIFPMINGGIPLWVITILYAIIDFAGVPTSEPVRYIAHIAGAATGFLFIHQMRKGNDWSTWMNNFFDWITNLFNPNTRKNKAKDDYFYKVKGSTPYTKIPSITQERIDKILDKITQEGYHLLTDEEKDILRRAANDGDL